MIIGINPPASLSDKIRERGLNVTLTGFVDDIRPHVVQAGVYVIPLFVGSGPRLTAFEAMAMAGRWCRRRWGVEGLDVTAGETFIRVDDATSFARSILALMGDAPMPARIGRAARWLVEDRFLQSGVARQFEANCLQTSERAGWDQTGATAGDASRNTMSGIRKKTRAVVTAETMINGASF